MNWAWVIGFPLGVAIFGVLMIAWDWMRWNMGWGQFARGFLDCGPRGSGKWTRRLRS